MLTEDLTAVLDDALGPPGVEWDATVQLDADHAAIDLATVDPCESCGQPIALFALLPHIEVTLGAPAPPGLAARFSRPHWQEVHTGHSGRRLVVTYRRHSPERCQLVRAGTPEPLDDDPED